MCCHTLATAACTNGGEQSPLADPPQSSPLLPSLETCCPAQEPLPNSHARLPVVCAQMPFEIEEDPVKGRPARSGQGRPSPLRRALHVATKLLFATGRAAWVTGTTLLVLGVPLIIEMDREAQAMEAESQAMGVLSGGAPSPAAATPAAAK